MQYLAHAGESHDAAQSSPTLFIMLGVLVILFIVVAIGIYKGKKRTKTAQPEKDTEL